MLDADLALTLSILVPVYNEAATVEQLLRRVAAVPFSIEREIIAVDDGSSDSSAAILRRLDDEGVIQFVSHGANRGKGAAMRTAAARAKGDILVIQDADLELDPNDLPALLQPILAGEAAVCFGTRFARSVPGWIRRRPTYWANRLLNGISNRLNRTRLTDFNTCYKMMTAEIMARLHLREDGFAIEPEITGKLARLGYDIAERPVYYSPRNVAGGKKIRSFDFFRYLIAMLRYRFIWSARESTTAEPSLLRPA